MKYSILLAIGLAMILPLQAAEKAAKAQPSAKASSAKVFKRKDKDHDSLLTKEEFLGKAKDSAKAEKRFGRLDKDADGKLTLAEFQGKRAAKAKAGGAKKAGKHAGKGAGKHAGKGARKGAGKGAGKMANGAKKIK